MYAFSTGLEINNINDEVLKSQEKIRWYLTISFWECFSTGSSFKKCLNSEQYLDQGRLADIVPIVVTASVTRLCSLAAV